MSVEELKEQKEVKLLEKKRVRQQLIERQIADLQKDIDYYEKELQNKPLLDEDTGQVYDPKSLEFQGIQEENENEDEDSDDENAMFKNTIAVNAQLMDTYSDTDLLLKAYSQDEYFNKIGFQGKEKNLALKVLNISRKGVSSKAERIKRLFEDQKIKQYEKLNMIGASNMDSNNNGANMAPGMI